MDWVKLSTGYYNDRKVRRLPDADAEVMFVRSLAYAGGEETGGFIPEDDVQLLSRRRRYDSCVSALLAAGLWIQEEGGYRLPPDAWDHWNGDLDVLARRRRADRERKRRVRRAAVSADTSADSPPDCPHPERERETEKERGGSTREVPHAARDSPPPRRCSRHKNDPDPPDCGACKERRLAAEAWDRDQAVALTAASHQAAAARRSTRLCRRCGTRHTGHCPDREDRP